MLGSGLCRAMWERIGNQALAADAKRMRKHPITRHSPVGITGRSENGGADRRDDTGLACYWAVLFWQALSPS